MPADGKRWCAARCRNIPLATTAAGSTGAALSYVPENEFTQDICDALLRQAQRYGVGIDEQRDSDGYSLQRSYLPSNEEARQLTRSC